MTCLIIRRELVVRLRSRVFLGITAFLVVASIGLVAAIRFFPPGSTPSVAVGVSGNQAELVDAFNAVPEDVYGLDVSATAVTDDGVAELDDGTVDVVVRPDAVVWPAAPEPTVDAMIRTMVGNRTVAERAAGLQISPDELTTLLSPADLQEIRLDGSSAESAVRSAVAIGSAMVLFVLISTWGSLTALGVAEEKSSRVVEVLLSHVTPRQIVYGKVIGLGLLSLGQALVVFGGVAATLAIANTLTVPPEVWTALPVALVVFVLGYAFYAALYAAVGSMVDGTEDANGVQLPVMVPILISYMITASTTAIPDNPVTVVASYVPFSSPFVLPMRISQDSMGGVQVAVSLIILAVSTLVVLRAAAWIYGNSVLRTGARVTVRDLWRTRGEPSATDPSPG
ncbi:MAG: ABC transporter permease [Acidimicrobiales bacterium]